MSFGTLQLIQTDGHLVTPGAHWDTEKSMFVRLFWGGFIGPEIKQVGSGPYWDWLGTLADYPLQGRYKIVRTGHSETIDTSYTIGDSSPITKKFWRYSSRNHQLMFCTMSEEVGGGLTFGQSDYKLTMDIVLEDIIQTKKGFGPAKEPYSSGRVYEKSSTVPFVRGEIYCESFVDFR